MDSQNVHQLPVREPTTKRADEFQPGDWLGEQATDLHIPMRVLYAQPFVDARQGATIGMTLADLEGRPHLFYFAPDSLLPVATEAEVGNAREVGERYRFCADLRFFADWLEARPWAPLPFPHFQVNLHSDDAVEMVHRVAAAAGTKLDDHADDRTQTEVQIGVVSYNTIAWHREGRPADPQPAADPLGLAYTRADDRQDPQPVAGRIEPHTGAMTDGGLVDESGPLVSDETIAEAAAMEERDRLAGGPPWEVPNHPENSQSGGWHHGQLR